MSIFQPTPVACGLPCESCFSEANPLSYSLNCHISWLLHDDGDPSEDWYFEIDVIESISELSQNEITLYTKPAQCILTPPQRAIGEITKTNCFFDDGGCSVTAPKGTFGDSFNKKGGGVWATQIEADGIRIWYFARSDIPADIQGDAPDPNNWGPPVMEFVHNGSCDVPTSWKKMKMVSSLLTHALIYTNIHKIFNITFCGDDADESAWSTYTSCSKITGVASCVEYVAKNPEAFDDVYFLINSIKTYH